MKRVAMMLVLAGLAIAACDRVVELAPGPDALAADGNLGPDAPGDGATVLDAGLSDGGGIADAALAD